MGSTASWGRKLRRALFRDLQAAFPASLNCGGRARSAPALHTHAQPGPSPSGSEPEGGGLRFRKRAGGGAAIREATASQGWSAGELRPLSLEPHVTARPRSERRSVTLEPGVSVAEAVSSLTIADAFVAACADPAPPRRAFSGEFICSFPDCGASYNKAWKLDAHLCKHTGEVTWPRVCVASPGAGHEQGLLSEGSPCPSHF